MVQQKLLPIYGANMQGVSQRELCSEDGVSNPGSIVRAVGRWWGWRTKLGSRWRLEGCHIANQLLGDHDKGG